MVKTHTFDDISYYTPSTDLWPFSVCRPTFHRSALYLLLVVACLFDIGCSRVSETPTPILETPTLQAENGQNGTPIAIEQTVESPSAPVIDPTPTFTPEPIVGNIVLWHSWAGADADALEEILVAAEQRFPGLRVHTLFVAYDDLGQGYAEAVQAGEGPDLVLAPNWWLGDMIQAGVVARLDTPENALIAVDVQKRFWPAALDNMRWRGELYGLPTNFEVVSLYFNRELISDDALPTTTDDFLALIQENPRHGIGLYNSLYHLYWGIPAYGGQLLDEDGVVILDQNSGTADYLRWLVAMEQLAGNFIDTDYGMLIDRFKKREFAFFIDGPWSIGELREALGENLGITRLPTGSNGPAHPWLSADGIFLNPNSSSSQQWLARAFMLYLTSIESGSTLVRVARRLPANRTVEVDGPILGGFMRQAEFAHSMPTVPEMDEVWGYGGDMLIKVLNGVADPDETVVETTTLINEANGK